MPSKKFDWKPIEPEQIELLYSDSAKDAERKCIGHLRGDFGSDGKEFWTSWFPHDGAQQTAAFSKELDDVVNSLRKKGGLLENRGSMAVACGTMKGTSVENWAPTYGFKLETDQHRYCLRCTPVRGDYNFYLYCYEKGREREQPEKRESVLGKIRDTTPKQGEKPAAPAKKTRGMEL